MEIVPGVHTIDSLGTGRAYLAVDADGVTLIDAGMVGTVGLLRARLRSLGFGLDDVRRVLLTHAHPDHTGGLAALVAAGAEVWAPESERAFVERGASAPGPDPAGLSPLQRWMARMGSPSTPAVPVARGLRPGEALDAVRPGLRTVALPGHTLGQLGYDFRSEDVLVAGDVLMHALPWWHPPLAGLTTDMDAARRSAEAVVARDPRVLVVGHGPPAVARPGRTVANQVRGALARFPARSSEDR